MRTVSKVKAIVTALALVSLFMMGPPGAAGEAAKPADYPTKPIHWIAPVPAGASVDLAARGVANFVDIGASIVIENIGGGSQTIGMAEAAIRKPDGYTWLAMANAGALTQPLMSELTYKVSDFRHIAMTAPRVQACIAVRADSPLKTTKDILDLFAGDKRFSYGVSNAVSYGHLAILNTQIKLGYAGKPNGVLVIYNGSVETITSLLSGETFFGVMDTSDAYAREKNGELRVLTILHNEKSPIFPDVDIISDYGVDGMGTFVGLKWLAVRKETPPEIVDWIKQAVNKAVADQRYQDHLVKTGFGTMRVYTEEEVTKIVDDAIRDYGAVMKAAGLIQ